MLPMTLNLYVGPVTATDRECLYKITNIAYNCNMCYCEQNIRAKRNLKSA